MEEQSHSNEQEIDMLFTNIANTQEFEDATTSSTLTIPSSIDNSVTLPTDVIEPPVTTTVLPVSSQTLPVTPTIVPATPTMSLVSSTMSPVSSTILSSISTVLPATATLTTVSSTALPVSSSMMPVASTILPVVPPATPTIPTASSPITLPLVATMYSSTLPSTASIHSNNKRPRPRYFDQADPKVNKYSDGEHSQPQNNPWNKGRGHRGGRGYRGGRGWRGGRGRRGGRGGRGRGTFTININL